MVTCASFAHGIVQQQNRMSEQDGANLRVLSDLCTPWCVHVVATLRVADHIRDGTTQVDELAAATGSDRDALHNVLRHLAGKGVFMEPEPGRFALNEAAEPLLGEGARFLDL